MPRPSKLVATRRQKIIDALCEVLTAPDSPLTSEDLYHFEFVASAYGATGVIDEYIQGLSQYPDVQQEVMVAILIHVLDQLVTVSAPGRKQEG